MKLYIYNDLETANRIARTIEARYGVMVEQRGTALKIAPEIYNKLRNETYATPAAWVGTHTS